MTTKTAEWGRSAELRSRRDWLGLSAGDMAAELNMSRRSYQRMERGDEPIPAGVWADLQDVDDRMDEAVERVVAAAIAEDEQTGADVLHLRVFPDDSTWDRQVLARAIHLRRRIVPKFADDDKAVAEMEGTDNDDRVPEQDGGSAAYRR